MLTLDTTKPENVCYFKKKCHKGWNRRRSRLIHSFIDVFYANLISTCFPFHPFILTSRQQLCHHYSVSIISCDFFQSECNDYWNASDTPLLLCFPCPPSSAPAIKPSVRHRGVHRPLLHSLQAVCYSAESGLTPQSGRYLKTHTHIIFSHFDMMRFTFN